MPPPSAAPPLSSANTADAQQPFPGAPAWLTTFNAKWADKIADAYDKNPFAADRDYKGKTIVVFGVIDRIEREGDGAEIFLRAVVKDDGHKRSQLLKQLDDNTRAVPCHFGADDAAKVADVSPGQLVGVRGVVHPPQGSMVVPNVLSASLWWAGQDPKSPPSAAEAKKSAVIAARSAEVCFGDMLNGAFKAKPPEKANDKKLMQQMQKMADTAHKDLAQLGIDDVSCPTASLFLDLSCEEAPKGNGVVPLGCSLPEVKAIMAAMQKGH